jgi:amino acid adenylation domain-containing protein
MQALGGPELIGAAASALTTIRSLIGARASASPNAPAILARNREPLTFRELLQQADETVQTLYALGVGPGDRIAMVLPNGPEAALCCFSASCVGTSAPLNPAYSAAEFEFYLSDLKPKVLILSSCDSPAARVAQAMDIQVVSLTPDLGKPAGRFVLSGGSPQAASGRISESGPDDVALALHTSGSTARPKLVPLTHANLCHSARSIAESLRLTSDDRCLNIMPLFHIHGLIGAVLSSWSAGASVVCTPGFEAPNFFDWLKEFDPSWYTAVPTMHQAILGRSAQHAGIIQNARLRFIRSCSAALPPKLLEETERTFGVPMVEAYGMTEASHQMTVNPGTPGMRKPGSTGLAAGCDVAIMSPEGELLPRGETGEVVIRGANVTRGYEGNPEANAKSFTSGWFQTGDQGRLDPDGFLFLTGRLKEIINRGGEKISPREVDEVLLEHPAVASALTFAIPDPRLGEDVAAAIVLQDGASITEAALREFAAEQLAAFKVPRRIVFLPELPKGPTGKPQRIGLAAKLGFDKPEPEPVVEAPPFLEPRRGAEKKLAAIWKEVLRIDRVGLQDDFFQLGGDSILATQAAVRIRQEFRVQLSVIHLFGAPRLDQLAKYIETAPRESGEESRPIAKIPRTGPLPLSFAQLRMWFLSRFEGSSAPYFTPAAFRLRGPLDEDALRTSLNRIIARHEVLRTTFDVEDGSPVQTIWDRAEVDFTVHDCSDVPRHDRETAARELARELTHREIDLSREFPMRAGLVRFAPGDHVLILAVHHIASDGWSKSVLFRELEIFYAAEVTGDEPRLPDLPIQYADYAQWRRKGLEGKVAENLNRYWQQTLEGAPALLELPTDRPRPPHQTFAGSVERLWISSTLGSALRAVSRSESATLYMTLLGAFQVLLARYSGQTDICIGTPTAFRIRKETEHLIGSFLNSLVMRTDLSGDPTFRELLARVRDTALGAYEHQHLPFERVIEVVQPQRSLSYSPLFQVLFQLRNFPEISARLDGVEVSKLEFDSGTAQVDLTLEVTESERGLDCVLVYNTSLFDQSTARRMLGHFATLLEGIALNPGARIAELPMLTAPERERLLSEWIQTSVDVPDATACQLFEEQVQDSPQAVAVSDASVEWSYAELDRRANAVASRLRAQGVEPGSLVAICAGRSAKMLAGLLGIWKAGAAYVPLDPSYPKDRLQFILEDSGATLVLTESGMSATLGGISAPIILLDDCLATTDSGDAFNPSPDDLAYVLYTSGSTGRPKGVAVPQSALTNLLYSMGRMLDAGPGDTILALTTISFDIAGLELFLPLICGARVHIAGREEASDGRLLADAIQASGATIVQATPATWQILADTGWQGKADLRMLCGGEALPASLAEWLCARGRVWNVYGPTETTIWSTAAELFPDDLRVVIGKPIDNTSVYVLDPSGRPVPAGVPGELYIGGAGLARGYWNRDELTAEKFVRNPIPGQLDSRLYRTGDLVRYLADGNLEFLHRLDSQVKLRGFRIELEEIESVLRSHPGVRAAAAKIFDPESAAARLVAFYSPSVENCPGLEGSLRDLAASKLPSYMVPSAFVAMPELPLTPNDKVDRRALLAPAEAPRNTEVTGPRDSTETLLVQIWERVLDRRPIGIHDDFFALGGHSLLGARLLARLDQAFGTRLLLSTFFEAPTVAQMAERLRTGGGIVGSQVIPIRLGGGSKKPLYIVQASPRLRPLTLALPEERPVFTITEFDPTREQVASLEEIAARQIRALRESLPRGPYLLAGRCANGVLAYEMAQQLHAQGENVPVVVMIDSFNPARWRFASGWEAYLRRAEIGFSRARFHVANLASLSRTQKVDYLKEHVESLSQRWLARTASSSEGGEDAGKITLDAVRKYEPQPYPGTVILFRARQRPSGDHADAAHGWKPLAANLEVVDVPGNHDDMLLDPNVGVMSAYLSARLP